MRWLVDRPDTSYNQRMTEFGQEVIVSRLSVEAALAEARGDFGQFHISPDKVKDLAAAGRTVSASLGYLDRLFADSEASNITPVDRLLDMYVSGVAYGLPEQADAAKQFLKGVYAEPKLTHRLAGEISHFMGVEKRIFGKYDNPRWERLHTARSQVRHTDAPTGAKQVEAPQSRRRKIGVVAGRLSLRSSAS